MLFRSLFVPFWDPYWAHSGALTSHVATPKDPEHLIDWIEMTILRLAKMCFPPQRGATFGTPPGHRNDERAAMENADTTKFPFR